MFDLFWSSRLTRANFRDYTRLENFDTALAPEVTAHGSITITVHLGSFEWMLIAMGLWGHTGLGVTEGFKNPLLTGIFQRLRQNGGCQMIEQERSMVRMLKAVKRGGNVGMLVDFNLRPDQPNVIIDCFGLKTCVTLIHAMLHRRTGAPLLPVESVPLPDGTSRIVAHPPLIFPPEATEREIAQACWDFFEKIIRANPSRWMWAYKHWRYRPRGTVRVYPFYANESGKFEKAWQKQAGEKTVG